MKLLLLLLTTTTTAMHAVMTAAEDDTFELLHSLANPNPELGFSEDAQGVELPDSAGIRSNLTTSQEDEIVQQTINSMDSAMFQGVSLRPSADEDAPSNPHATPSAQESLWTDLVSQLAPRGE